MRGGVCFIQNRPRAALTWHRPIGMMHSETAPRPWMACASRFLSGWNFTELIQTFRI